MIPVKKIESLENNILLINKPCGLTSFQVIAKLRNILHVKKAGHAGTLDKAASGLLVIGTGKSTKLMKYFLEGDKKYTAEIQLGIVTDTCDREGEILQKNDISGLTKEKIISVLESFEGEVMQRPPLYSALKIGGKRASDLAREGKEVTLKERKVVFHSIKPLEIDPENGFLKIDVFCSSGTYIRSLARDIGELLGTGAYMTDLKRIASSDFTLENSVTLEELDDISNSGKMVKQKFFYSPDEIFLNKSSVVVHNSCSGKIKNGVKFKQNDILSINQKEQDYFAVYNQNSELLALSEINFQNYHVKYLNVFN